MRKLFTLLILMFFWAGSSFGQITIGTGTTNNSIPVNPFYGYSYSQMLYLQSQITVSGNITTLQFYFSGTSLSNSNNWTIYMGHTSKTAFASTTDWIPVSSMTQVYSGIFTSPTSAGWITFDITDFAYNNIDNLVIAVDENAASYNTSTDFFYSTASTTGRSIRYSSDATNPDPAAPPTGTLVSAYANVILGGITLPSCTAPVNQPTALVLTPLTTSVTGAFTAAAGSDSYLVVRTSDGVLTAPPVNGIAYTVGGILGNGTVVSTGGTSFTASSLTAGTLYYFHVFSKNAICAGGPLYLTTSPLVGSVTTAPNTPVSITASASSSTQINLVAAANATGNDIMVAWTTDNVWGTPTGTYTNGSPITGGGTVLFTGAAASLPNHTGLTAGTQYYYRAWSVSGGVYSSSYVSSNATTYFGVPYSQNFNASTSLPAGWSATFSVSATHGAGGTNGLYRNMYSSVTTANAITPSVVLSANLCRVVFDYRIVNYTSYPATGTTLGASDKIDVGVSTDGGTTYTILYTIDQTTHVTSNAFANKIVTLTGYNSQTVKVRFFATWGAGDYYVDFDNVMIEEIPSCAYPTALTSSSITNSAASIGWTGAATVEIDYAIGAHTAGTGTIVPNVTANPYGLTGLTSNSTYYVYVRQNCGAGNLSAWAGPIIFTTLCNPTTAINENFDAVTAPALPSCWSKYISPAFSFETVNTYTTAPNSAPNCVQIYSSGAALAIDAPLLISPQLSNLGAGTHQLKFNAKGASTNLSIIVGTMSDPLNAATFTPFQTVTGLNSSTWTNVIMSFASYSGSDQYIAIAHPLTTTYTYIYIDDVVWEVLPACPQPSALTATTVTGSSAVLGWNANGTTAWEIEWGTSGFVQGTGTTVPGVTNPYTLSGLAPTTAYSYYVRANCGGSGYSAWAGPVSFTTTVACPAPTSLTTTAITSSQASLGFTNPGGTLWNIEWGLSGFVQGTGTVVSVSTNPYVLTGLTANTAYSWYIQQNCGGSQSTWAGPSTFTTACAAVSTPFGPETFEVAVPPSCWTRYSGLLAAPSTLTTTTSGWAQDDWRNVTSPVNKAAKVNVYGTTNNYWLMTPQINLGAGSSTLRLEFDLALNAWNTSTAPTAGPDDRFAVVISTDGGLTWTSANTLREWNNTGSTYVYDNINYTSGEHVIIPLTGYTGTIMIGFYTESTVSNGDNDLMIDNVAIQEPPACAAPSAILATAVTSSSATISWTAASPAPGSGYQWEVRTSGAGGSGATGLVSSGSTAAGVVTANVTGLASATTYSVYVRSSCGASLFSVWTGPTAFTTSCNTMTSFTENFDAVITPALPSCWNKIGAEGSSYTQTTGALSSPNCLYIYAASGTYGATMAMPVVSNAGANTNWLTFKLRANFTVGGIVQVGYMTDRNDPATFNLLQSFTTTSSTVYQNCAVIPGTAPGASQTLAFRMPATPGYSALIDDVVWEAIPSCLAPSALVASAITATTATISWTASASLPTNGYQWEVRTSGAGGSGATGLAASGSTAAGIVTANVTGLTSATSYSIYVRSNCGGSFSSWAGPSTFATSCGVFNLPYTQNFDAVTAPAIPICMSVTNDNADAVLWVTSTSYPRSSPNSMYISYNSSLAMNDWFFSAGLNLPVGNYKVSFWYRGNGAYDEALEVKWGSAPNAAGMTSAAIFTNASILNTDYVEGTGLISVTTPGTYYVGWHGYSAADMWYMAVDDISITQVLAHDIAVSSIDLNAVVPSGTVNPMVTVKNEGTNAETFTVNLTIGAYTSTQTVTALGAGLSQQVTFAPWTAAIGDYTATATTTLAGDLNPANNSLSKAIKVLNLNKQVYAYNAYANLGTDPEGPVTFNLNNPGDLTSLADQSTLDFVTGGTWAEGVWYGSVYSDVAPFDFVTLNTTTGARTLLGTQTVGINGLSYNRANSTMYGVAYDGTNTSLYSINMTTGATTLIGSSGARLLINLAINTAGVAYAVDLGADVLGTINLTTGAFTSVGSIGFDANYAQDMEFDRETGELYMAAQDANSGWLAWVNQTTGAALKIGDFEGGAEITGLAIPYTSIPPTKTINLTGVMLEGLYAGGGTMNQANDDLGPKFGPGVSDVITVELHNSGDYYTVEHTATGVELSTTGTATVLDIPAALNGNYYITIRHRNSIEVTTASPVSFAGNIINQSFALPANVYGGNLLLMLDMGYAIFGGDVTQDGYVDTGDVTEIDNDQFNFMVGYVPSDVNGDGFTDTGDVTIVDNNQFNFVGAILP